MADQRIDDPVTAAILGAAGVMALLSVVTATLAAIGADPILCVVVLAVTIGVLTARIGNRPVCAIAAVAATVLFLSVLARPGTAAGPAAPDVVLIGFGALLGRGQRWLRQERDQDPVSSP